MKFKKKSLLIAFLFAITTLAGIYLRVSNLLATPPAISMDEADHYINGRAIRHTGKDFQGDYYFWELLPSKTHTFTAELNGFWHALIPDLNINPLVRSKIINELFGFLLVLVLPLFSYKITKSKLVSSLVFIGILFSPWHILVSRNGYEAPIAITWLVCSMTAFLYSLEAKTKKTKLFILVLSILSMIASFYSYHGYKIIFPFIYLILFIWDQKIKFSDLKNLKIFLPLIVILLFWLAVFLLFLVRLDKGFYGNRQSEIPFLNADLISAEVNHKRQASLSEPLQSLFFNKGTVVFDMVVTSFYSILDPQVLFANGMDGSYMLGLGEHGLLYFFEAPLIIIGVFWLLKKSPRSFYMILLLIGTSFIPVIIHEGVSIVLRSNIFIPLLVILSAHGVVALVHTNFPGRKLVLIGILITFIFSVLKFQNIFFTRYPVQNADYGLFEARLMSSYAKRNMNNNQPVVILAMPFNSFRIFMLYADLLDKPNIEYWQGMNLGINTRHIKIENIIFTDDCEIPELKDPEAVIVANPDYVQKCKITANDNKTLILPSPLDNRDYYRIYNDKLCEDKNVPAYIRITNQDQFAIEAMSDTQFCENWTRIE